MKYHRGNSNQFPLRSGRRNPLDSQRPPRRWRYRPRGRSAHHQPRRSLWRTEGCSGDPAPGHSDSPRWAGKCWDVEDHLIEQRGCRRSLQDNLKHPGKYSCSNPKGWPPGCYTSSPQPRKRCRALLQDRFLHSCQVLPRKDPKPRRLRCRSAPGYQDVRHSDNLMDSGCHLHRSPRSWLEHRSSERPGEA